MKRFGKDYFQRLLNCSCKYINQMFTNQVLIIFSQLVGITEMYMHVQNLIHDQ